MLGWAEHSVDVSEKGLCRELEMNKMSYKGGHDDVDGDFLKRCKEHCPYECLWKRMLFDACHCVLFSCRLGLVSGWSVVMHANSY